VRFIFLWPLFLIGASLFSAEDTATRHKRLNDLIANEWEFEMRTQPESATIFGDNRYNDQLSDYSLASLNANVAQTRDFLRHLEAFDTTGLPDQDQLNRSLLVRKLRFDLQSFDLKLQEAPIDQFNGFHLFLPEFVPLIPFHNTKDYENYLSRLHKLPRFFDQQIILAQMGERDGLMPPKHLLEKVIQQSQSIASGALSDSSPFLQPLKKFPDTVSPADQARLRAAIHDAIQKELLPAYQKFTNFVKNDYAPKGRLQDGIWSIPNGPAIYSFLVALSTTTSMTPSQIHELGWKQVAETEAAMTALAHKQGYADLKSFQKAILNDPRNHPKSREDILDHYRKYTDQMYGKVGELFGRMPKARLTIVPVESFREKEAADAEYQVGSPDGSRRGRVVVNTGDFEHRTFTELESTAYHEGVPGHHFQLSIAQELPALPPFRQHAFYSAFTEGWGLYAERLGKEVGFYQDPVSEYGRLASEMLRSVRLVVDTGVHAKKWTRQQMVDYFHEHSSEDEPSIQAEVDRYIAWPGQALAYKVGQLKILELRERARTELGAKFDIRAFHDEVLGGGTLPLDILDQRITAWIALQKGQAR
jgi:uncharacterized protein (DUF885 family)